VGLRGRVIHIIYSTTSTSIMMMRVEVWALYNIRINKYTLKYIHTHTSILTLVLNYEKDNGFLRKRRFFSLDASIGD